ncbi:MAG: hypothetical protein M3Z88_05860 [Bombilactobacillus mellifer]|nr:hypothetical protein [Bombilactobacillus mellifer]MCT6844314.1 hypothetical protein [Bombilactobacillus mellifer]
MVQLPNLSRHRAFTLVETIIALNLICWLIIIPSIDLGQQWQIQQEKLFLLKFQSNWNWSLKRAFLEKSNCVVEFNSAQHIITFRDYRPQTPNVNLTLPKTLNASLKRNNKLTIHADGSVEPTTIYFVSQLTKRRYTYTVQKHWGRLFETQT